jgi:dienelactone hydrolase
MEISFGAVTPEKQLAGFVDKFEPKHRALIRSLRKALRRRLPTAHELVYDNYNFFVIGYSPTERPSDAILSLAAAANGVSLFFLRGASLPDPKRVLSGSGNTVRSLRLESAKDLSRSEVEALVSAAVAHSQAPFRNKGKGMLIIRSVSKKQRPRRKLAKAGALLLALLGATMPAAAQEARRPFGSFAHGVDYTFERMTATVPDRDGRPVTLVSYVYVPLKGDRREAVLFSHGSTAAGTNAPEEPIALPRPVIEFFVSRGYTLVAPMRRGRSESGGAYVEECGPWSGGCPADDPAQRLEAGLGAAIADSTAVLDQVVFGRLVPKDAKVLYSGYSRGGFLSLALAARRPDSARAVISFAGGWMALNEGLPAETRQTRVALQSERLAGYAKAMRAPALWIYAARDPFYDAAAPRQLFDAFKGAGGQGEFVFIDTHTLPTGHAVASDARLWRSAVEAFLAGVEATARRPSP